MVLLGRALRAGKAVPEAAQLAGVSRATAFRWIAAHPGLLDLFRLEMRSGEWRMVLFAIRVALENELLNANERRRLRRARQRIARMLDVREPKAKP